MSAWSDPTWGSVILTSLADAFVFPIPRLQSVPRINQKYTSRVRRCALHAPLQRRRLILPPPLAQEALEIFSNSDRLRMVGSKSVFEDVEGAPVERLRLVVLALALEQQGEVVQATCGVGMVGSEDLFDDLKGAPVERLRLVVSGAII